MWLGHVAEQHRKLFSVNNLCVLAKIFRVGLKNRFGMLVCFPLTLCKLVYKPAVISGAGTHGLRGILRLTPIQRRPAN